jgi:hypothetical protein
LQFIKKYDILSRLPNRNKNLKNKTTLILMHVQDMKQILEQVERLVQFASKAESTPQLQAFWYNRYISLIKEGKFMLSQSTIQNVLQAELVQKPITPSASLILENHFLNSNRDELDESQLQTTLEVMVRLLDSIIDSINFSPEAKSLVTEYRKIGISIADFNENIFPSLSSFSDKVDYIGSLLANGVYRASEALAEEKGVCQGWESINKKIKSKSFEYWFNIDTGEIKSGIEITQEFNEENIFESKFEIVPRRNSHILLLPSSGEWSKWTDRDRLISFEFNNSVIENEKKESSISDEIEPKSENQILNINEELTQNNDNISEVLNIPVVEAKEEKEYDNLDQLITNEVESIGQINEDFIPSFEQETQLNTQKDEVVEISSQVENVNQENAFETDEFITEKPVPEMINLDDLLNSFSDDEIKKDNLFNPDSVLDKIKQPEIKKPEFETEPEKKNGFNLAKIFNPFGKKSEETAKEVNTDELKVGENNIDNLIENVESKTSDLENIQNQILNEDKLFNTNFEGVNTSSGEIANSENKVNDEGLVKNDLPELIEGPKFEEENQGVVDLMPIPVEINNIQTKPEQAEVLEKPIVFDGNNLENLEIAENEFTVGELVQVVDKKSKHFGKYLQIVDIFDYNGEQKLILVDGTMTDDELANEPINVSSDQIEPASIESVLSQLNKPKAVNEKAQDKIEIALDNKLENQVEESPTQDLLSNLEETLENVTNTENKINANTLAKPEKIEAVKVLLVNEFNEALFLNVDGEFKIPSINLIELDESKKITLAISEILYTKYNIAGISNLNESGTYAEQNKDQLNYVYYGFVKSTFNLENPSISYFNIVNALEFNSDLKSIINCMSQHESNEQSKNEMVNEEISYQTQTQNTINNDQEDDIMKQINSGSIDDKYGHDFASQSGSIETNNVVNTATNKVNFEPEIIKPTTYSSEGFINPNVNLAKTSSNIAPTQVQTQTQISNNYMTNNQPITQFPKNQYSNTSNMIYQSTSSIASYSKFSVLLKQIITTAEFGNIHLHIHYDANGPRVITVELPQLINDSVLQVLRTYLNLLNASLIRGSELSMIVSLIQDQLDLAGESGPISVLIGIILNAVNALPKTIQEVSNQRIYSLDQDTAKRVIKTGVDPLKALAEKYLVIEK